MLNRVAASRAESAKVSQPIDADSLCTRLTSLKRERDSAPEVGFLRSPPKTPETPETPKTPETAYSTPPAATDEMEESSKYYELIKDGGRPVCPIEVLLHIFDEPTASYEPILPWLSDSESVSRNDEVRTVFTRQFERWWDFRKWQWNNRGTTDGDEGFAAYLAVNRNIYKQLGAHKMAFDNSFDEMIRGRWQQKPEVRLPDVRDFSSYKEALKRRMAPFNFKQPLQLLKDPYKQTEWTTWLEYFSFEQFSLEQYNTNAEVRHQQHDKVWKRLLSAARTLEKNTCDSQNIATHTETVTLDKPFAVVRANLGMAIKAINSFIRGSRPYRDAQMDIYQQKNRLQWILKEAHVIEAGSLEHCEGAKQKPKSDVGRSKKRKRSDSDDDTISTKVARRGRSREVIFPDTALGQPRRSRRIHFKRTLAT